jgi:hypothetical protein
VLSAQGASVSILNGVPTGNVSVRHSSWVMDRPAPR